MTPIHLVCNYILVGAIMSLLSDLTMRYIVKQPEIEFTNIERLAIIVFWPLYILIILFGSRKKQ